MSLKGSPLQRPLRRAKKGPNPMPSASNSAGGRDSEVVGLKREES